MQNPVGFDLIDFLELGFAALAVAALLSRPKNESALRWIANRPWCSMGLLFALPIVLRLCLLANHPVPVPSVSDDFSYLLLGDTLRHFRLANPAHPMHRFFETVFVLQEPTYSSIYPLGQGFVLMLGWAGVLLSVGLFCALTYWMLRGWVSPAWALIGGLLAVMLFGPLNQWTNNYWGGAVSAIAGCLVFGSIPRRNAVLLGLGLALQILTRPFEAVLLLLCVVPWLRWRVLLAVIPALGLTLLQNEAVTGSWTRLPYMLSREQYGIPAAFTFQKMPEPHRQLTQEQQLDYLAQKDVHDSSGSYWPRWAGRLKFLRFFLLPPMYIALLYFVPELRRKRYLWAAGCMLLFSLGTNIYPYFYPHYIAAVACLFLLMAVVGLAKAPRLVLMLCGAHFIFWYSVHLFGNQALFEATGPYESWDYINFGDSEGRIAINARLHQAPGKELVFVRYSPRHLLREWVHNDADIDAAQTVWALDLGPEEDAKLTAYYPQRTVWVVEPDSVPPRLTPAPSYRPAQ
ncbi:MAG: hypothetical protein M3N54_00950 [Acidobacteriota bacterium]|nr:hypothetical protein [Acidobacteriota bacterium]